uniref:RNA-dependent RNA polymerase n=1 Tax=Ascaris lumbricoides TaxID=6252 RepID=A0A0M3ISB0_ASCLU
MESLERLLNMVDERRETPPLLRTFECIRRDLLAETDQLKEIYAREELDGYRRVRKVVLTPTRMLLVVPELLMGNRVLRTHDESGDRALRVQFRDDDGTHMKHNTVGPYLIQTTVHNALVRGVYIADRHFVYLASSNSQMRDNGCYFFDDGDGGEVKRIRRELGVFDRSNIPKLMARMGQCFTQAKECSIKLLHRRYNKTFDIIGGMDSSGEPYTFSDGCGRLSPEFAQRIADDLHLGKCVPSCFQECSIKLLHRRYNKTFDIIGGMDSSGEPYTFSDGCGRLSPEFAQRIADDLHLGKCVPSCFQIRFRGIKGVVSVDPWLTERSNWATEHNIADNMENYNKKNKLYMLFRPSQDKFHAPLSHKIEIVKYSSPTPVCLNRPYIAILDQVRLNTTDILH